ncbi:MAG: hypothetical protein MJ245_01500 [Clostridia bacterium]|nr:hypothetical protein [Clostridia bacterium]
MMNIDPYIVLSVVIIILSFIILLLRWYHLSESYFASGFIIGFTISIFYAIMNPDSFTINFITFIFMGGAIGSLFKDKNLERMNYELSNNDCDNNDDESVDEVILEDADDGKVKILYQGRDDRRRGFEVANDIIKNHENITEHDISYDEEPGIYDDAFLKNHDRKVIKNFLNYLTNDKSKYKIIKIEKKDDEINKNELIMEYEVYLYDKKEKEIERKKKLDELNDS